MIPHFALRTGTDAASWIAFCVLATAVVYVSTRSAIARPLRMLVVPAGTCTPDRPIHLWLMTLIYCPSCTGFWVGVVLGILRLLPITSGWMLLDVFLSGCASMVLCGTWMHVMDPTGRGGENVLQGEHPELFEERDVPEEAQEDPQ